MSVCPQRLQIGSPTQTNCETQLAQIMGPNLPHATQTVGENKSKALLAHFKALGNLAVSVTVAFKLNNTRIYMIFGNIYTCCIKINIRQK